MENLCQMDINNYSLTAWIVVEKDAPMEVIEDFEGL